MKSSYTLLAVMLLLLFSFCNRDNKLGSEQTIQGLARGGIYYGGILKLNEVDNLKSLMPIAINEINSYHVSTQVYEGLVKYDQKDLRIHPALARSWDISEDKTEYIFHIRSKVKFHNDSCFSNAISRYVTALDVKFCFENLCSKNIYNTQYDVTFKNRVEGANDFYAESGSGKVRTFRGLKVIDDSTILIKLTHPDANFLNILTMPGCYIYPKEAYKKYGNGMRLRCIGTGPFFIDRIIEGDSVILKKNNEYWAYDKFGNRLPYLNGVQWTFIHDKNDELLEFRRGNLDMIYNVPAEMIHGVLGDLQNKKGSSVDFNIYASPALTTHYYGFNVQTNPFFSIRALRRALNLAVDREEIVEEVLKGEGSPAFYGIVPYTETFEKNGYDYKSLKGFIFDKDSARKLLALAGYPDGKGLPDFNLEINSGGGNKNIQVALAVQKMLKENLGVNVNLSIVSFPEHIENVQTGKSDFFRYAWTSDYSDPESFLTLFYGQHVPDNYTERSYINFTRFKDPGFDILYAAASTEPDIKKRYKLLSRAEQNIIDEAPFMPLFYGENSRMVQKFAFNLPENPLNYIDLSTTYLKPKK